MASNHKAVRRNDPTAETSTNSQGELAATILQWPEKYMQNLPHELFNVERMGHSITEMLADMDAMWTGAEALVRSAHDQQTKAMLSVGELCIAQVEDQTSRAVDVLSFQAKWTQIIGRHLLALPRE